MEEGLAALQGALRAYEKQLERKAEERAADERRRSRVLMRGPIQQSQPADEMSLLLLQRLGADVIATPQSPSLAAESPGRPRHVFSVVLDETPQKKKTLFESLGLQHSDGSKKAQLRITKAVTNERLKKQRQNELLDKAITLRRQHEAAVRQKVLQEEALQRQQTIHAAKQDQITRDRRQSVVAGRPQTAPHDSMPAPIQARFDERVPVLALPPARE